MCRQLKSVQRATVLAPGFSPLSALVPLVLRERKTERLKVLVPSYCGSPDVSLHFQFIPDIFPIHAWVCSMPRNILHWGQFSVLGVIQMMELLAIFERSVDKAKTVYPHLPGSHFEDSKSEGHNTYKFFYIVWNSSEFCYLICSQRDLIITFFIFVSFSSSLISFTNRKNSDISYMG